MFDLIPEPTSMYDARRQASCLERANQMGQKGYKAQQFETTDKAYFVDGGSDTYIVALFPAPHCSCPDFARHGGACKHIFFICLQKDETVKAQKREVEERRARCLKNRELDF